jgi:hypothetical protein
LPAPRRGLRNQIVTVAARGRAKRPASCPPPRSAAAGSCARATPAAPGFRHARRLRGPVLTPDHDFAGKVLMDGLEPGRPLFSVDLTP